MRFLIGLDDTDSPKNSSTGLLARQLGFKLQEAGLGTLEAITRHQLFSSQQVPCTTRNSAICLSFEADPERRSELEMVCRSFILREYCPGANTGFALASWSQVTAEVYTWARTVKSRVVNRQEALITARAAGISIAGLIGSGAGVIGALAAIGLRYRGDDGRFIWLPGIEELIGVYSYSELMNLVPFDRIENLRGRSPKPEEKIHLGEQFQAALREGRCVLLVEEVHVEQGYEWHTIELEKVRKLAD